MMPTKTLIILTPGFPANEWDSTCLPSRQLFVKACKDNYPAVKFIVLAFQYPFKAGSYTWNGITVQSFNGRNKGKISRLIVWRKVWIAIEAIHRRDNLIGILSFWLGDCALIGSRFSRRYKVKHLTWLLGQDARITNQYQKYIRPASSDLIALSDFVADEYEKNFGSIPEHVVPVGIDTSLFDDHEPPRDIDVMGAGSLIPLKRYDLFVDIIGEVAKRNPNVVCIICGKGPENQALSTRIKKAGLGNNISLIGEVPHSEILKLMQRSKVFLHTSEYEGYGTVCAEALYAGAHVVSFLQPMRQHSQQQHIVQSKQEAVMEISGLLLNENRTQNRILDYSVDDVSKRLMDLFAL